MQAYLLEACHLLNKSGGFLDFKKGLILGGFYLISFSLL